MQQNKAPGAEPVLVVTVVAQRLGCSAGVQSFPAKPATVHFTAEKGMGDQPGVSSASSPALCKVML